MGSLSPLSTRMVRADLKPERSGTSGGEEKGRKILTPEILEIYGELENPAEPLRLRDIVEGFKHILNKRVYGFNKRSAENFASLFPLFHRLRYYHWRWVRNDILAGFIVGMMQFTQVLGNSQTASIKPEVGLAILFFPGLVYGIMASSLHNSVGGMAITSATVSVSLMNIQDTYYPHQLYQGKKMTDAQQLNLHSVLAPGIAFVAGVVQVVLGIFKLGFLSAVLSPNVLQPFTLACFLQSICGKIPSALGIDPPVHFTYAKHFKDIIFTFRHLHRVNGWEVLMSCSMATIVLVFREYFQPRIFQRVQIVVPIEFIMFVIFTAISYALDLEDVNVAGVRIVGTYNYGLPTGSWPDLSYGWELAWSGVVVGIVSYSTTLESAKILARRSDVGLSANQELLALGSAHIFSSFFSCYPVGAPVGRGLVNESMGSQSQLSTLVACLFAGLMVGYAGPAIRHLPVCLISVNMILFLSMSLGGFAELPNLWRNNKVDGAVWAITFLGCITFNVQIGLFVGIGLSMIVLIVRSQKPKVRVLGVLKNSQWGFAALKHYDTANEFPGVRILQLQSPLIYATADYVVKQIVTVALEPYVAKAAIPVVEHEASLDLAATPSSTFLMAKSNPALRALAMSDTLGSLDSVSTATSPEPALQSSSTNRFLKSPTNLTRYDSHDNLSGLVGPPKRASRVVLDLGSIGYMDSVGIRALEQIASDLKGQRVEIILAQCTGPLLKQLKELELNKIIPERNIFPSVADAVEAAIRRNQIHTSPADGMVAEYGDDRFWDVPVVPVDGLPVVDYHQD